MAIIKWTDELSVHIHEIDDQHKKLIDLINKLHEAMLQKQGKQVTSQIIDELAAYTVYHFQTEETYMQKFKYPAFLKHKKEHEGFVTSVENFQKDFEAGKLGLSLEIMTFLKDWVTKHIKGTDMQYSATFKENGI